jgi:exodeoxyribonuclease VIII
MNKHGILSMSGEQYRAADGISKSDLDWIAPPRTPAHFRAKKSAVIKAEETPAMRLGSLTHRAILEPDTMEGAFVIKPEDMSYATKDGKAWREEQALPIIMADEAHSIGRMVDSVWANKSAARILKDAKTEMSLFAEDENGTTRKCRLDALTGGNIIPDIKTCASADVAEFERSIAKYRYYVQAAYYLDICELLEMDKKHFVFICVEKAEPYAVAVYSLAQQAIEFGRAEYKRDLAVYRQCLESDSWPGFSDVISEVGLPSWMSKQLESVL